MKNFLVLTDLDSTFEEFEPGKNQFLGFIEFVNKFENRFNVQIKIHFISGTNKEDLKKRLTYLKTYYPEIYKRVDYAVLSGGKKFNKNLEQIGKCDTDRAIYSKADGVQDILNEYGRFDVAGAVYMGDDKTDVSAFETIRWCKFKFPFGAYAIAPRSRRAYDEIKSHIDFYSDKPRILGCIDCLNQVAKTISKQNENIKN